MSIAPSAFTAAWAGGSTPTSPSVTISGSCSSRLRARQPRSTSARGHHRPRQARRRGSILVVSDIEAARAELVSRGVDVGEIFHVAGPGSRHQRSGSGTAQLLLVRHVQRSGRQQLAVAGGHRAIARTGGRERNDILFGQPTWRAHFAAQGPRTASTRNGSAGDMIKPGRTGTPSTWWRNKPARRCRNKFAETSRSPGRIPGDRSIPDQV